MVALTKERKKRKYTHLTPERCRAIRACLEWTRKDLAKAAQCSPSTVGDFENFQGIGFDMLINLEEALIETGKVRTYSNGFEIKEGNEEWRPFFCKKF